MQLASCRQRHVLIIKKTLSLNSAACIVQLKNLLFAPVANNLNSKVIYRIYRNRIYRKLSRKIGNTIKYFCNHGILQIFPSFIIANDFTDSVHDIPPRKNIIGRMKSHKRKKGFRTSVNRKPEIPVFRLFSALRAENASSAS